MNIDEQSGKVLHASHDGVQVLRFVGEIRYLLGPALERFLERLIAEKPSGLVLDFSETDIIDSTCLGLLARMALQLRRQGLEKATLVSPRPDITEVLRSLSFDRLFHVVGEMPVSAWEDWALATSSERNRDSLLATMLGAHRTLMTLSEQNRLQFKDVVAALEKESEGTRDSPGE